MSRNRVFQTGAKIQSGGLNAGFASVRYQPSTEVAVTSPPAAAAAKHTATLASSATVCRGNPCIIGGTPR